MGDSDGIDAEERVLFLAFVKEARSFWIVIQIMMGDSDDTDAEERHPLLLWKGARRSFLRVVGVGQMPTTPSSVTSARCLVDKVLDDEEGGDLVQDELTWRRGN